MNIARKSNVKPGFIMMKLNINHTHEWELIKFSPYFPLLNGKGDIAKHTHSYTQLHEIHQWHWIISLYEALNTKRLMRNTENKF